MTSRNIREAAADIEDGLLRSVPVNASEARFMAAVIRYARFWGWTVYHTHDSRHSEAGFPDLTMRRMGPTGWRVVAAELKQSGKVPTPAQSAWLQAFNEQGVAAFTWTPADLDEIEKVLR